MVEIIDSEGVHQGRCRSGGYRSFITYGAGQIISGLLGDKINPKKLITWGLAASALMNFAVPLCKSPAGITAVWCVNGFAQALMWPPIVRIFSEYLTPSRYKNATVKGFLGQFSRHHSDLSLRTRLRDPLGLAFAFLFCGRRRRFDGLLLEQKDDGS